MTWRHGTPITPAVGGFYDLRAGLSCYIEAAIDFYGMPVYRGRLLPPTAGTILWHPNGAYSPTSIPHELDIMKETTL